jgi:hypothetical protein
MDINYLIQKYINIGYNRIDATSKVCQDIILYKRAQNNWLNLPVNEVTENVITFLNSLNIVSVN